MTETDSDTEATHGATRAAFRLRNLLALTRRQGFFLLAGLLVLALAGAVVMTVLSARQSEVEGASDMSQRNEVRRVASAFAANLNTYSADKVGSESYRDRVEPLLTKGFRDDFDDAITDLVQQMRAHEVSSEGEVLATGVSAIDADSAVVLVVSDADVTTKNEDRARHFRWRVDLVQQGDDWLVDGFEPQA